MKKKLSKALQAAIKAYITHRDNQATVKWNKEADQDEIERIAFVDKFVRCEQCCGTWWFTVRRGKNFWVFECNETDYNQTLIGKRQTSGSNVLSSLFGRR